MATKQYTNVPETFEADPENWEFVPNADKPAQGAEFPRGATEITAPAEGEGPVAPDPRLGMNPQGEWTPEKAQKMFPEMFPGLQTQDWLDPAEEAKKREGMPYDPNKRYDEKKLYPGINGPMVPGAGGPDVRPPQLRIDRKAFEQNVFKKIGGNPFLMNPYDELIKADRDLPDLFNHVFQGRAVWSDLAKLDKDERAYWEKMKKEYHERTYNEAKAKKSQMEQAYKWMMGQFDYDQKIAAAELSRADKLKAKQEAAAGKTPPFREIYNADGIKTLHVYDATTGQWTEQLGKNGQPMRTGQYDLDDLMPPNVRFAQAQLNKLRPQISPQMQAMMMLIPEKDREKAQAIFQPKMTPEQEKEAAKWEAVVKDFSDKYLPKAKEQATAAKAPEKADVSKDLALIVNAKKSNHPRLRQAIAAFKTKYPDQSSRLEAALNKVKGSHYAANPHAGDAE